MFCSLVLIVKGSAMKLLNAFSSVFVMDYWILYFDFIIIIILLQFKKNVNFVCNNVQLLMLYELWGHP